MIKSKKGQMGGLENAPLVVMIIGLVFLSMATFAFIGERYGTALLTETSTSVVNETGHINSTGYTLAGANVLNANGFAISVAINGTDNAVIGSGNYTVSSTGVVTNATAVEYGDADITYSYSYDIASVAYNSTDSLQTELSNNTSIAGIILTISLIGIVLTLLIGVFLGVTNKANRV